MHSYYTQNVIFVANRYIAARVEKSFTLLAHGVRTQGEILCIIFFMALCPVDLSTRNLLQVHLQKEAVYVFHASGILEFKI